MMLHEDSSRAMASALRKQLNVALSSTPAALGCQCTWQRNGNRVPKSHKGAETEESGKTGKRSVKLISVKLEGFGRTLDMLNA